MRYDGFGIALGPDPKIATLGVALGPDDVQSGLGQIPAGITDPIGWIKGRLEAFYRIPNKIALEKRRGQAMLQVLRAKGDMASASQVEATLQGLSQDQMRWYDISNKIAQLQEILGTFGISLGALPLLAIPVAGAVIVGIIAIFSNYSKHKDTLDRIESGALTADEVAKLRPSLFGVSLGGVVPLLALGVGAWLLLGRRR